MCTSGDCSSQPKCAYKAPTPAAQNWTVDCNESAPNGYNCYKNVHDFVAAMKETVPDVPHPLYCTNHCRVALICDPANPCIINGSNLKAWLPSNDCAASPFPCQSGSTCCRDPFHGGGACYNVGSCSQLHDLYASKSCMNASRMHDSEACLTLLRQTHVYMANVVMGPHTSTVGAHGGLLYVNDKATVTGVNVTFTGGKALLAGGAIALQQGKLACKNCVFKGNEASAGGAIYNLNIYGSIILEDPTFSGNTPSANADCHSNALGCCICQGSGCPACCLPHSGSDPCKWA